MSKTSTSATPSSMIGPRVVAAMAGVSRSTIGNWIRDGVLPPPIRFSPRCTRWRREVIEAHLAKLEAEAASAKAG